MVSKLKSLKSNYRPISLLSSFSKIFEKLMHFRLVGFLEENNALHDMQYSFRPGRSCEHALLAAQNEFFILTYKKTNCIIELLIDFSKAFDMVDHNILLDILHHYGIRGIAHKWFKSYLTDRKQYVNIDGHISTTKQPATKILSTSREHSRTITIHYLHKRHTKYP